MWPTISNSCICCIFLMILQLRGTQCHLSSQASTPSNKVELHCELAESCIHDTIAICGKMGDERRSFLDHCDLLEYACDTDNVFVHIEDEVGCPVPREKPEPIE